MKFNKNTTIVMSIDGGLGNQLFQIGAALSLFQGKTVTFEKFCIPGEKIKVDIDAIKMMTGRQVNISQVNLNQRRILNLCLRLSSWKINRYRLTLISVVQPFVSFAYSLLSGEKVNLVIAKGPGYFEPRIRMSSKNIVIGYFQSFRFAEKCQIEGVLQDSHNQSYIRLRDQIETSMPIVVHVRLGDYYQDKSIGVLDADYFSRALRKIVFSDKPIWVFSNDLEKAREIIKKNPHFDVQFIDDNGLSPIELLDIMTRGHGYVLSNSTFGWWAAYLRLNKEARVIVPTPWFSERQDPLFLIPKEWQQENRYLTVGTRI